MLDTLPVDVVHLILDRCRLSTLTHVRALNRQLLCSVQSFPACRLLVVHQRTFPVLHTCVPHLRTASAAKAQLFGVLERLMFPRTPLLTTRSCGTSSCPVTLILMRGMIPLSVHRSDADRFSKVLVDHQAHEFAAQLDIRMHAFAPVPEQLKKALQRSEVLRMVAVAADRVVVDAHSVAGDSFALYERDATHVSHVFSLHRIGSGYITWRMFKYSRFKVCDVFKGLDEDDGLDSA